MTKIFAPIFKTSEEDDGSLTVEGYASTGEPDSQGEIVTPEAMKAALPQYMKFGAVREMHQLSAVGTALHAEVDNGGRTLFRAKIIDPAAIKKVKEQVYKGFSIGANATARKGNKITGLHLVEVSLVDVPTNPEAVILMYKSEEVGMGKAATAGDGNDDEKALDAKKAREADETKAREAAVEATMKAEEEKADKADEEKASKAEGEYGTHAEAGYADPGYQDDKQPRYPLKKDGKLNEERIRAAWNYIHQKRNADKYTAGEVSRIKRRIVAAWKEAIDEKGPPEATKKTLEIEKGMRIVQLAASTMGELSLVHSAAVNESSIEGDKSKVPDMILAAMEKFSEALKAMVEEETIEIMEGTDDANKGLNQALNQTYYATTAQLDIMKAGRRHSKADEDRIRDIIKELRVMLGEEVAEGTEKGDGTDATAKTAAMTPPAGEPSGELVTLMKSMVTRLGDMQGSLSALTAENAALKVTVEKIQAQPADPKGSLLSVTKGQDIGEPTGSPATIDQLMEGLAVFDKDGNINKTATIIKATQRVGGQPLLTGAAPTQSK